MLDPIAFNALVDEVRSFFPKQQLGIMIESYDDVLNEDRESTIKDYIRVLERFREIFTTMPKTYETEAQKLEDKVVYLHYFVGGCDWFIIEKDKKPEQLQAYGVADLGYGPELGYIPISELIELEVKHPFGFFLSVELDFHWQPTKVSDIAKLADLIA